MTAIVRFGSGYVATIVSPELDQLIYKWKAAQSAGAGDAKRWLVVRERLRAEPTLPTEVDVTIDLAAVEAIRASRDPIRVQIDVGRGLLDPQPAPDSPSPWRARRWPWQVTR